MRPTESSHQLQLTQPEFDFPSSPAAAQRHGLGEWREKSTEAMRQLAIKLGLPLSHRVEVCLKDGVILRGNLRVGEVLLALDKIDRNKMALQVDGVIFFYGEMEFCVRL